MSSTALLTDSTRETITSTIPVLREHGTRIVQQFYANLFVQYPEVRGQFDVDRQSTADGVPRQVSALANAILLYAQSIHKLDKVIPLLRPIAEKHVSRGVTAKQYDAVGECLITAIKQVLGTAATDVITNAWGAAYTVLKDVFIAMEDEIREENEKRAGWSGLKEVRVRDNFGKDGSRFLELDVVVPGIKPGTFISVVLTVDQIETMTSLEIVDTIDGITVSIANNKEMTTTALLNLEKGDVMSISVPCGTP